MPEGLEAEIWRSAAQPLVGRRVSSVVVDERVTAEGIVELLPGARIEGVGRRGKIVTLHLERDAERFVVGLHFGMTGRLVIDGESPIERLEYASSADRPEWDRLCLWTGCEASRAVPALRLNDPRRLGRVSLGPDTTALGPEASTITANELSAAITHRRAVIKTVLLDQHAVAGLGNLCADEVLFHAAISPHRGADSLTDDEVERLADECRMQLAAMLERGGSTSGVLDPALRAALGACPLDGHPLRRETIGGRTAIWCSRHQR